MTPRVEPFFDHATFTWSYLLSDPSTRHCAIIDPVLDYDPAASKTTTRSADAIVARVKSLHLQVDWILDTHVHADHLSGASYLKERLGGKCGIGAEVVRVQRFFSDFFDAEADFRADGSQFDRLFGDGESFKVGDLSVTALHTPGHTAACVTYVCDGAAFVGDTIFMPDYGTARTDFPGGDAGALYRSIRRILALPADTTLYMCHDYGTDARREFCFETTVADQRANNVHIRDGISEAEFIRQREERDAMLAAPRLLLPSVQFNMRGARLPPAAPNGVHYFKIPVRGD